MSSPSNELDRTETAAGTQATDASEARPEVAATPADEQADWQQRLHDAEKRALQSQAELENFRRRQRRESDELLKYASLNLIADLLDVSDNLARALASADEGSAQAVVAGVRMVQTQLAHVLEKHGCRRIDSVGQPFDPNVHSAILMQPSDTAPANTVAAETRGGYRLHDRVVRPAEVVVSTGSG